MMSVYVGGLTDWQTTGVPDEYVQVAFWDSTGRQQIRIYSVAEVIEAGPERQIRLDVVLHDAGVGSTWSTTCRPGDRIAISDPAHFSTSTTQANWQLLVCDLTALPAALRRVNELGFDATAELHVVLTDPADEVPVNLPANVTVSWQVVPGYEDLAPAMASAVSRVLMPLADSATGQLGSENRYVWVAGEAGASRAVRRFLRRDLGWEHDAFLACGYWQVDAAEKNKRYIEVADEVARRSRVARAAAAGDEGAYQDALDDIFDSVGL